MGIESKVITNCQLDVCAHVLFDSKGRPTGIDEVAKPDTSSCVAEIFDLKLVAARRNSIEKVVKCQITGCQYFGKHKKQKNSLPTSDLDPLDTEPPFLIT